MLEKIMGALQLSMPDIPDAPDRRTPPSESVTLDVLDT